MTDFARWAQSFGRVASLYDQFRPGYPDDLYADILSMANGSAVLRPVPVLDGPLSNSPGATRECWPSSQTRRWPPSSENERTQQLDVRVQQCSFEDCTVEPGSFDIVVSAQAWHWINPDRGAAVAAHALRDGGLLALWWNRPDELSGPVWNAISATYQCHAPSLDRNAVLHAVPPGNEEPPDPAPGFGPWNVHRYRWSANYDADSYSGLIQTHSDHQILPPDQLDQLVAGIRAAINDVGDGHVEYPYQTVLLTARPESRHRGLV